ncbi:MAG: type IV secretory system conjugative DNA transfer family protein [Rickettsiales bacterium]
MIDNSEYRYGSARPADSSDARAAGLFNKQHNSLFVGFLGNRPLYYNGMGGVTLVAGARSGKFTDILAYSLCSGICDSTIVVLDPKGEAAAVSHGKSSLFWNPTGLHGLPQYRINPVDYLHIDNPTLISDMMVFCENAIPLSGSNNGQFFELEARIYAKAFATSLVEQKGVLTFPDLYHALNLIPANNEEYLNFAYEMSKSRFDFVRKAEQKIAAARNDTSGGFIGTIAQLLQAFAPLADPILMRSVSPPYDFSLSLLCKSDQTYQLYLMPPAQFIGAWSLVIKSMFVGVRIYKERTPSAPQQTYILDEAATLGHFPMLSELFTIGAGINIRPVVVYQSIKQMNNTVDYGENLITSSAALQIYFAARDYDTANMLSKRIGTETLNYDDERYREEARHAKRQAVQTFLNGNDPIHACLNYTHHRERQAMAGKQARLLRSPDEVLNTPRNKLYLFVDGLPGVLYADRKPYYQQRFMKGRYKPNPYYQ